MRKLLCAAVLAITLSGCMEGLTEADQARATSQCLSVGGKVYFAAYDSTNKPQWAYCFVNGFKYRITKQGEMYSEQ